MSKDVRVASCLLRSVLQAFLQIVLCLYLQEGLLGIVSIRISVLLCSGDLLRSPLLHLSPNPRHFPRLHPWPRFRYCLQGRLRGRIHGPI